MSILYLRLQFECESKKKKTTKKPIKFDFTYS